MNSLSSKLQPRHWGYFALAAWAAVTLFLLRQDMYVLNEGAAKALLLCWSIADQVASSVITFGTPDLRALLYLPIGFLWTGNVFPAKVFTVGLAALAVWLLFGWKQRNGTAEQALLASGLLLISPLTLAQIDSLAPGVYLLAAFTLGAWLNEIYRATPRFLGGWYFSQLFISVFAISLHPAGLAYPLSLLWSWYKAPLDNKQQKSFFIGIGLSAILILVIRLGWNDLSWAQNPITQMSSMVTGVTAEGSTAMQWAIGAALGIATLLVVVTQRRIVWNDFTGRTLLLGAALGAFVGDEAWALIVLSLLLYFGIPLLLPSGQTDAGGSFLRQRGLALAIVFVASTFFMIGDRTHYEIRVSGLLPPHEQLIKTLADDVEAARTANEADETGKNHPRFVVASQWPSRTMIACKCDTLPLPPAAADPQAQLAQLQGGTHLTHLLLDPKETSNIALARNLSLLGGVIETSSLQSGGVLLHLKDTAAEMQQPASTH